MAEGFIARFLEFSTLGEWDRAATYLKAASEFGEGLSDYWYCSARYAEYRGEAKEALKSINRAFEIDQWKLADPGTGAALQYRMMFRLKQYREQIALYEKGYPVHSLQEPVLEATIRSCLWGGFRQKGATLIDRAISLYPDNQRFLMYRLLLSGTKGDWEVWLYEATRRGLDMRPVLDDYMIYAGQKPQIDAVRYWKSLGGNSGQSGKDLYRLTEDGRIPKGLPDGGYYWDGNRDGYPDENIEWSGGVPRFWSIDRDQDGQPELHIRFDDKGIPLNLKLENLVIEYSSYPHAARAVILEPDLQWESELLFHYGALKIPLSERDSGDWGPDTIHVKTGEQDFFRAAYRITERSRDVTIREYVLEKQAITVIFEDTDGNGVRDRELRVEHGQIVAGYRDLNEDGVTDIHEYYQNGIWEGLAWDSDGDNTPEYYHDWSMLPVRIWDTDGDGRMDVFYLTEKDGTLLKKERVFPQWLVKTDFLAWDFKYERHWFR